MQTSHASARNRSERTGMKAKIIVPLAASVLAMAAGAASAQTAFSAYPAADGIPQPHLAAAKKLAAENNNWSNDILTACYSEEAVPAQKLAKDPPPTKMADNLYYLGNAASDVYAVDTSDGIVLIDSLTNQAMVDQFIIGGLQKLGVDPSRIKAVINTHLYYDHAGGDAYLQDKYHARIYMGAAEWDYIPELMKTPRGFVPPKRDVAVKDGDTLTMGDTTIRMYLTPSRPQGQLGIVIPVKYKGEPHTFVSVGPSSRTNMTPAMHAAFDASLARFIDIAAKAHADGVMSDHSNYDDIAFQVAMRQAKPDGPNPFIIGTAATQNWLKIVKECNLNNRDIDVGLGAKKGAAGR